MPEIGRRERLAAYSSRVKSWSHDRLAVLFLTVAALSIPALVLPATAAAGISGQIGEAWGTPGTEPGQFYDPAMFGVDPVDGSIYAGDLSANLKDYRLQKFSETGVYEASVEIPRFSNPEETKIVSLHGIAIDASRHLLYLIESCRVSKPAGECKTFGTTLGARRILIYSTEPEGPTLVPPSDGPAALSLPTGGETLYNPQSIAIDPSNGDLVILAENSEGHAVVQRITTAGVVGARFVDTNNTLKPDGGHLAATSIAVGPNGVTYTVTGGPMAEGSQFTRAWELPPELSKVQEVPGFAAAAEAEDWYAGFLSPATGTQLLGGPELAVSPDGNTLYWKESIEASTSTEAGDVLVRGYALASNATKVLYGGGTERCAITTPDAGIATTGEKLVVFDYGPPEGGINPPYGGRILTFGPGGSGCAVPTAKFSINGKEEENVTVEKGELVSFSATNSELFNGFRRELTWEFGDGTKKTVEATPESGTEPAMEAEATVTHKYIASGQFTIRLKIELSGAPFGSPPDVERTLAVIGSKPKFKLTVSDTGSGEGTVTSAPGGIACGASCEAEYEEGTIVTLTPAPTEGSEFKGWSGACTGSGTCEVTISQVRAVSAEFAAKPKLTVSDTGTGEGTVTSSPTGISCGATCAAQFSHGTVLTLSATAAEHSEFKGWSGACTGTGTCEVTMSEARSLSAEFAIKPRFKLSVSDTGPGEGTVTSSPGGINCGASCEAEYERGVIVTLVPAAAEHSEFKGWSGACTGTGTCEVTMSEAKSLSAEYLPVATPRFMLRVSETGAGLITSIPDGIACGAICERGFEEGTLVTLVPIPAKASEFKGWSGDCSGAGVCEVTMSQAREVKASFGNILTVAPIEPEVGGGPPPGSEPNGEKLPHHHHRKPKTSALVKCKRLKGKKKAKCIRHAHRRGR
ncbi:MAG: PKD domain-containing protein [Solirubrobacterales bacterium]